MCVGAKARCALCLSGLAIALFHSQVFAQVPPTAGEVAQQTQNAPALQKSDIETPQGIRVAVPKSPAMVISSDHTPIAEVTGYRIEGNTAFPESALLPLVTSLTGKLSVSDLYASANRITEYYRRRGYLVARAYIPQQEIKNGVVLIAVLEGRYEQIGIRNRSRLSDHRIQSTVEKPICGKLDCGGSIVATSSLERGLLILSDTPGALPSSQLERGSVVGTSRLDVDNAPAWLLRGIVEVSNYGNYYTGDVRGAATLIADNPFGFGDQFLLQAVGSRHEMFGGAQYSLPLNYDGTRLAFHYDALSYSLGQRFSSLIAHGMAQTADINISHPFLRRTSTNVTGTATFAYDQLRDYIDAVSSSNPRFILVGTASLEANHLDRLLSRPAVTNLSVALSEGNLQLRDPEHALIDALSVRTAGRFNKLNYSASRLQQTFRHVSIYTAFQAQVSTRNLDSFEKFFPGGPTGVLAYPVGEAPGDRGFVATTELRWQAATFFGGAFEAAPLFDYGLSHLNARPYAPGNNEIQLYGPGLRLSWAQEHGLTLGGMIAFRRAEHFESEPDRSFQAWLYASYRF